MQEIKIGSKGEAVKKWQSFLHGLGYMTIVVDGIFGEETDVATRNFQQKFADADAAEIDGVVGTKTYLAAIRLGFPAIESLAFPPRPAFDSPSSAAREKMFGKFRYTPQKDGSIKIEHSWTVNNIVHVFIPQLIGIEGAPKDGMVYFHRDGAEQLKALFAAWQKAGLLKYLKSWAGSFVPRMVRGSKTQLSNHAFGSAFDVNAAWNGLGKTPAATDKPGTVIPLVAIANAHGFFWGGHYNSRKDGMHFELAVLGMFPKSNPFDDLKDDEIDLELKDSTAASEDFSLPPVSSSEQSSDAASGFPYEVTVAPEAQQAKWWKIFKKAEEKLSEIQATVNKVNEVKESLSKIPGVSSLPGMRLDDAPVKVTTGKSTSFLLNVLGMVFSVLGAIWGFLTNNYKLIALGIVGFIILLILLTTAFTIINALRMKYHSDPTKYNVE
ncbi:MAG TPA: M15 family metallopeptidase [Pyrinomonadaceae bacterium]|nr:M15 family metallopeptidase [Pyrinomonadaceae bacterium]